MTTRSGRLDREFDVYRLLGVIEVLAKDPGDPDPAARLALIGEAIAQFDARHARVTRIGRGGRVEPVSAAPAPVSEETT